LSVTLDKIVKPVMLDLHAEHSKIVRSE